MEFFGLITGIICATVLMCFLVASIIAIAAVKVDYKKEALRRASVEELQAELNQRLNKGDTGRCEDIQ